jgi:hypothetical protein
MRISPSRPGIWARSLGSGNSFSVTGPPSKNPTLLWMNASGSEWSSSRPPSAAVLVSRKSLTVGEPLTNVPRSLENSSRYVTSVLKLDGM